MSEWHLYKSIRNAIILKQEKPKNANTIARGATRVCAYHPRTQEYFRLEKTEYIQILQINAFHFRHVLCEFCLLRLHHDVLQFDWFWTHNERLPNLHVERHSSGNLFWTSFPRGLFRLFHLKILYRKILPKVRTI